MPKEEIIVGLDIGSNTIRAVVGQMGTEELPNIIGVGQARSSGIRRGMVVDVDEAVSSISSALEKAERITGIPVEHAFVGIGGAHIESIESKGVIAISRADGEVTEEDVARVIEAAQAISIPSNQEILHIIPKTYTLDNQKDIKDPVGMNGIRLEVNALIVVGSSSYAKNLTKCIYRAGVDIDDIVLTTLAASNAILSKRQKELGVVLIDIGGGTTGMIVFEEGDVLHSKILPIGGGHITNDIAIGLRTSIDVAERIKLEYGFAVPSEVDKKEKIDLSKIDSSEEEEVSRFHVSEIIEARLSEIFSMVDKELKKVKRSGKLPAGVVITGGGAKLPGIVDIAKRDLKLPVQIGFPIELPITIDKVDDPSFATAVGLVLWGSNIGSAYKHYRAGELSAVGDTVGKLKKWFKSLLP